MKSEERKLGRYQLVRRLGAGGMGEVWLAELHGEGGFRRPCAVKTMLPHLSRRDDIAKMFEREAVLAGRVAHENVVHVFDLGRDDGVVYLAMEYVEGGSARALCERTNAAPLALGDACSIVADAARGLAALHALKGKDGEPLGLVHRDVTLDNILLTREGLAKIGDFGIAVARDVVRTTETGELKGKIPYMSPEQLTGDELGPGTDVFSLGICLWMLLTGKRPFDRGTDLATMNAIVKDPTPPLVEARADAPEALCALVARMLAKDAALRPEARTVVDDLLAAVPAAAVRPRALVAATLAAEPTAIVRMSDVRQAPLTVATGMTAAPARAPRGRAAVLVLGAFALVAAAWTLRPILDARFAANAARDRTADVARAIDDASSRGASSARGGGASRTDDASSNSGDASSSRSGDASSRLDAPPARDAVIGGGVVGGGVVGGGVVGGGVVGGGVVVGGAIVGDNERGGDASGGDAADHRAVAGNAAAATAPPAAAQASWELDAPMPARTTRVALRGPSSVVWSTTKGKRLGRGDVEVEVADKTRQVVAVDEATGGRSTVPVQGGAARFDALPRGRLDVRANPWADVFVGRMSLGTTPMQPRELPVGRYRVKLKKAGVERTVDVDVKAGGVAPVRVDMTAAK